MGSFSWTRAEATTRRSNLANGDRYKILVPKEFGGGYIKDIYYDYGEVFSYREWDPAAADSAYYRYIDGNGTVHDAYPVSDLYGILAYWNDCSNLSFDGESRPQTMNEILLRGRTHDQDNRVAGIHIGCYADNIDALKFPLKLVSPSYKGTYEDCRGRSYGDPNQGFGKHKWSHLDYADILKRIQSAEAKNVEVNSADPIDNLINAEKLQDDIVKLEDLKQQCDVEGSELLDEVLIIFKGLLANGEY